MKRLLFTLLLCYPLLTWGGGEGPRPRYSRQPERQHNRAVKRYQRQARESAAQLRKQRRQVARQEPRK